MGGISGGSGAVVKSRQSGTATFNGNTDYSGGLDVTVSSYDATKSLLRCLNPGTRAQLDDDVSIVPKTATTINLKRWVAGTSKGVNQVVTWEILEFY